jgi:hypothetical protein
MSYYAAIRTAKNMLIGLASIFIIILMSALIAG